MELQRISDRVWVYPYEEERDRPYLGYIRGDRWSFAVDAGHSSDHTESFYNALRDAGLPLPSLTVLTHWHWDHTFGMHAVNGLCLANARTDFYLHEIREKIEREGTGFFFASDEKIRREYAGNIPVVVTMADMVYTGEVMMDAGNCPFRVFQAESPHTDDSTLIHIPGERVLFLGDAAYGAFPTWESDPVLCRKLAETIIPLDAEICVMSHHDLASKQDALQELQLD